MKTDMGRVRELVDRARTSERRGETARALGQYDDALALFEPATLDPFLADVLRWKGTLLRERGETEAAYRNYNQSLVHASRAGATPAEAHALNCLGIVAQRRGDPKEAERLYERAASLAEASGESRQIGRASCRERV